MSRKKRQRGPLDRRRVDFMRAANNLAAWLEVRNEFLRLGISAQRFYACRARVRDRRETDEEVVEAFNSWQGRSN